ncbi:hypothetical protein P8452_13111 [Trifolium repens]|nr:hypothetical protein P8452_13111 [Trifolium repens]
MCNKNGMAAGLGSENIHADDPRPSKTIQSTRCLYYHMYAFDLYFISKTSCLYLEKDISKTFQRHLVYILSLLSYDAFRIHSFDD